MIVFTQDVRYALRQLRRAPGFAMTAMLTLALGIGVTVTVMALVYRVLLAPLPYPEAQRIVGISFRWPGETPTSNMTGIAGVFLQEHARSFSSIAFAGGVASANLSLAGEKPVSIPVMTASQQFFRVLGVQPMLGHGFTQAQDTPGGTPGVVFSYGLWRSAFGGDRGIVGRTIHLDGQLMTVDGVMPGSFAAGAGRPGTLPDAPAAWRTQQVSPNDPGYEWNNYGMIARLRDGVSVAAAQQELQALQVQLYHADPLYNQIPQGFGSRRVLHVWPYAAIVAADIRPSLVVMSWAVGAALLLTCLNLAGLNMARALYRAPEFGLRMALGATQARVLRLVVIEAALLVVAGGAGALMLSQLLLPFLLHNSPVAIPQLASSAGSWSMAAAATALALGCAVVLSAPYLLLAVVRRGVAMAGGQRSASPARAQQQWARGIVAAQVGVAVVLLSAATLLLGTFLKLRAQPLGFTPQKLVVFDAGLKGDRYATTQPTNAFVEQVITKLENTPGVSSAAAVVGLPLQRGLNTISFTAAHPTDQKTIELRTVTPGFLETMGLHLLAGASFARGADAAGPVPAIISEAAARAFWPGQSALGRSLCQGRVCASSYRVVGIVNDAPATQLGQPPDLTVYTPMSRQDDDMTKMLNGWFPVSFVVKEEAKLDAAKIAQAAVSDADATIPVTGLTTMRAVVDESVAAPRFFMQIAEGFAAFAVLLTAIGMFGLLSYQIAQRTREIGVRMALGASRGRILRSVLQGSALLCTMGAVAGGVVAVLLVPVLTRWVEIVAAIDPSQTKYLPGGVWTVGSALCVLGVTALVAAWSPARRASRVEPMEALRAE